MANLVGAILDCPLTGATKRAASAYHSLGAHYCDSNHSAVCIMSQERKQLAINYSNMVCRIHFVHVGGVVSLVFAVLATLEMSTKFWHYTLALIPIAANSAAVLSTMILRRSFLALGMLIILDETLFKGLVFVGLFYRRIDIYQNCYLHGKDCTPNELDARLEAIQLESGISLLVISTAI